MGFDKEKKTFNETKREEEERRKKLGSCLLNGKPDALSSSVFATGMFFGTTTNAWSTLTANVVSLLPPLPVDAHTRNCPSPRPKWPIRATTHVPHPTRYQPPFKSLCQVLLLTSIICSTRYRMRIIFSLLSTVQKFLNKNSTKLVGPSSSTLEVVIEIFLNHMFYSRNGPRKTTAVFW